MKKLIIAISLISLAACTKPSSTSTPSGASTSTWSYDMNIPGYSYHRSGNDTGMYNISATIIGVGANEECQLSFSIFDYDIMTDGTGQAFFGFKHGDTTSKTGTYILTGGNVTSITDAAHVNGCNEFYNTNGNSTITITIATSHEIKGTINFIGYNGCDTIGHVITGDFDYNH